MSDLQNAIGRRVAQMFPSWSGARVHETACQLEGSGAFQLSYGELVMSERLGAVRAAREICPSFVASVGERSLASITNPAQRTIAQLRLMGIDPDLAFRDGEPDDLDELLGPGGFGGDAA